VSLLIVAKGDATCASSHSKIALILTGENRVSCGAPEAGAHGTLTASALLAGICWKLLTGAGCSQRSKCDHSPPADRQHHSQPNSLRL
jgi:hypothetical protein